MIKFKPHRDYLKNPQNLANRIAGIIGWTDVCPPTFRDGLWQLNATNDYWLVIEEDECRLTWRHYKAISDVEKEALRVVIEWAVRE